MRVTEKIFGSRLSRKKSNFATKAVKKRSLKHTKLDQTTLTANVVAKINIRVFKI